MSTRSHDGEAELSGDFGGFVTKELKLLAGVADVYMNIGRDFQLRLEHLAGRLSTGRPVHGFEEIVGSGVPRVQRPCVGEEILLLDAKAILGFRFRARLS